MQGAPSSSGGKLTGNSVRCVRQRADNPQGQGLYPLYFFLASAGFASRTGVRFP